MRCSSRACWELIGVLAGISFAAMTLLMRKQKDGSVTESIILGNLIAGLIGLPSMLGAPSLDSGGWTALIVLGVVQLGTRMRSTRVRSSTFRRSRRADPGDRADTEPGLGDAVHWETPGPWPWRGRYLCSAAVTWRAVHSIRGAAASAS